MRIIFAGAIVALSLVVSGCSDSATYGGGSPVAPTPTPPPPTANPTPTPPGGVVTIDIVRDNGAQSFSPNPATLPAGQMVVWRNVDSITHRVVLNNGSVDTGDLGAGASSRPMSINTGNAPYHCSIHPSMVGTIVPGN
jgi:plastocyanin